MLLIFTLLLSSAAFAQDVDVGMRADDGLAAFDGTFVKHLAAEPLTNPGLATPAGYPPYDSKLRAAARNGIAYGIKLVPTADPTATRFKVKTSLGTFAIKQIDTQSPTCTITSGPPVPPAYRTTSSENIGFTCSDPPPEKALAPSYWSASDAWIECAVQFNGGAISYGPCNPKPAHNYTSVSATAIASATTQGTYTFYVRTYDTALNVSNAAQTTWRNDLFNPSVTITAANVGSYNPTFNFTTQDYQAGQSQIASTYCQIDNVIGFTSCASGWPYGSIGVGGTCYTFRVYTVDNSGRQSGQSTYSWCNGGWSGFTACDCSGNQYRYCNNPAPSNGGVTCQGPASQGCAIPYSDWGGAPACPTGCGSAAGTYYGSCTYDRGCQCDPSTQPVNSCAATAACCQMGSQLEATNNHWDGSDWNYVNANGNYSPYGQIDFSDFTDSNGVAESCEARCNDHVRNPSLTNRSKGDFGSKHCAYVQQRNGLLWDRLPGLCCTVYDPKPSTIGTCACE